MNKQIIPNKISKLYKINGFSLPLEFQQVFSWILLILDSILFYYYLLNEISFNYPTEIKIFRWDPALTFPVCFFPVRWSTVPAAPFKPGWIPLPKLSLIQLWIPAAAVIMSMNMLRMSITKSVTILLFRFTSKLSRKTMAKSVIPSLFSNSSVQSVVNISNF